MSTLFYVDTSFTTDGQRVSPWFIDRLPPKQCPEQRAGCYQENSCDHNLPAYLHCSWLGFLYFFFTVPSDVQHLLYLWKFVAA